MAKKKAAPRPQHKRVTLADKVREVFRPLSKEDLANKDVLEAELKKARLKVTSSDVYRIRNEFLKATQEDAPKLDSDVFLRNILLVKKTAEQVGGLANLKGIVSVIERVQQ